MLLVLVLAATPLEIAQEWETRGDDGKAIAELTVAVTKDPAWSIGRVELGRLQLKQGLSDTALENLDIARTLAPENPRAHYLFALAASDAGRHNEARRALEVALALREDYPDAQLRLANVLMGDREFVPAATLLAKYVTAHADDGGARLQYADALAKSGQPKPAEAQLRALLDKPNLRVLAGRRLAALLDAQGRRADAEAVRKKIDPPKKQLRELQPSRR
jgi:uncharacterized protein (TIGR02996 family)